MCGFLGRRRLLLPLFSFSPHGETDPSWSLQVRSSRIPILGSELCLPLTLLESTLAKVYQHKQLQLPYHHILAKNTGGGVQARGAGIFGVARFSHAPESRMLSL